MMIWFAGILQNTRCNNTNENKTNKKTLSCKCGVFYTITRIDWHYVTSVCFTANTQITHFSFQVLVRRKSLFQFFGLYLHFFSWVNGNTCFWARPSKIAQASFLPMDYFFGCVLEETHGTTPTWKPEGIAKCRLEICNWVVRN